ncbi:MAG: PP2C family protein-serine/threonine phosphatase, partial [Candidatus Acidiferrales bacterium]
AHNAHTKSPAFKRALLESERLRIVMVLIVIGCAFVFRTVRLATLYNSENQTLWLQTTALLAVFAAFEFLMLTAVRNDLKTGRELSPFLWISNIIVETSAPAFAIALLPRVGIEAAYRPLANPATLVFGIFIILSTLRLDPKLCRFSGMVASVSYLLAAAYLGWRPFVGGNQSMADPEKTVFAYAMILFLSGFIAGAVAAEIRKHVDAALREAETRRQVERLEHDLDVARTIQQSLLPTTMPEIEGFQISAWNQPADQTGGDYFDWQPLPDGKVLVALADVTGHGIGPALLAAVCRAYARTNFHHDAGLLSAMERINVSLAADLREGRFVTFVAAICHPDSPQVELLSAGHGPLFLYTNKEDRFDAMNAHGMPLGMWPDLITDPPQLIEMVSGDLIILATDGFYEWENPQGEQFGAERLEQTIRASKAKTPAEIISDLHAKVLAFSSGTPQKDDLTAVIIKRC